ncbi:MAG: hypothetical protein IT306_04375 [Chloroflexi bacterium]|nr:hypothetical protein [Chloroflexota bacterium]
MTAGGLRRLVLLLSLLVGAAIWPLSAQAQTPATGDGVISGTVANGTAGGAVPADLEVTVHVLTNRAKTDEKVVRTDGNGQFQLGGLATGPEMIYFTVVEYQGVVYFPDRPIIFQDGPAVQTTITVFDASPMDSNLFYDRLNLLLIDTSPTALTIMEMGSVNNPGDKTFAADPMVTGSARTLRFNLPPGATQISPQAGLPQDSLEQTPDGFATTDPVKPGRREIAFGYELPYQSATLDLSRTFSLPVGAFTIYVPGDDIQLIGPGFAMNGTADLGGRTFRRFEIQNVTPGADVRFRLSGLPAPFFGNPRDLGLAVVGSATLALVVFVILAVRRRRQAAGVSNAGEPADLSDDPVLAERHSLLRSVAELDEQFAAGSLDQETYQARRGEQKARLVALTRASADA